MEQKGGEALTTKDVRGIVTEIVNDASELILKGVERMFEQQIRTFDRRFRKLEECHADFKRQLTDRKVDTPTPRQYYDYLERIEILEDEHMG